MTLPNQQIIIKSCFILFLQVLNWDRRFDNMQQHTGQHLISALFEKVSTALSLIYSFEKLEKISF
jgi:Ser-tRNA(Ala) deacylase AlaX